MSQAEKKILVTGATGFVGRWFLEGVEESVALPKVDLKDREATERVLEQICEEAPLLGVVHLAAQASPRLSLERVQETWNVNVMGTVHLLEALTKAKFEGAFLQVSTGAVYGRVTGLVREDSPLSLGSPYVASKLAAETAVLEWGQRTGCRAMVVRPFNHSGPGQSEHYFLPSMAKQIVELGSEGGTIEVGNLKVHKDFLHVKDVVEAYRSLLRDGRGQEIYNLASGSSQPLEQVLSDLAEQSGRPVRYRVSPERYREESCEALKVDVSKLQDHTAWAPQRALRELLCGLIEDWKTRTCQKQRS